MTPAPAPSVALPLLLTLPFVLLFAWRARAGFRAATAGRRLGAGGALVAAWAGLAASLYVLAFADADARARRGWHRRQVDAPKWTLRGLYAAERASLNETDRYEDDFAALGFQPGTDDPFTYELGVQRLRGDGGATVVPRTLCRLSGTDATGAPLATGVHGTCPACEFAALAAHVLDDGRVACWSVASVSREGTAAGDSREEQPVDPARGLRSWRGKHE